MPARIVPSAAFYTYAAVSLPLRRRHTRCVSDCFGPSSFTCLLIVYYSWDCCVACPLHFLRYIHDWTTVFSRDTVSPLPLFFFSCLWAVYCDIVLQFIDIFLMTRACTHSVFVLRITTATLPLFSLSLSSCLPSDLPSLSHLTLTHYLSEAFLTFYLSHCYGAWDGPQPRNTFPHTSPPLPPTPCLPARYPTPPHSYPLPQTLCTTTRRQPAAAHTWPPQPIPPLCLSPSHLSSIDPMERAEAMEMAVVMAG